MVANRKDLGELTDIEAVNALMPVQGLSVADVGCGAGLLAAELMARGASVVGVEPDPVQAEKNRTQSRSGLSFVQASAEELPFGQGTIDGVFFFRSLHHVPADQMDAALAEAARVLKPSAGFLCVVEPGTSGNFFPVMRPFNDETSVRAAAQAALGRKGPGLFSSLELFSYLQRPRYKNFETFVSRVVAGTVRDVRREQVETDEVRSFFEAGRSDEGEYVFEQPMLLNLYRGVQGG